MRFNETRSTLKAFSPADDDPVRSFRENRRKRTDCETHLNQKYQSCNWSGRKLLEIN